MALIVTIRVPSDICSILVPGYGTPALSDKDLKGEVKRILEFSIRNCTEPSMSRVPADAPAERINLSLSDVDATYVRRYAKDRGLSEMVICQQILMAAAARPLSTTQSIPEGAELLQHAWKLLNSDPRPEQAVFFTYLRESLSGNNVGLVEGATGIGKTLAILVAAAHCLQENSNHRLTIAVPTLMLMEQFCATHQKLIDVGFTIPPIRPIVGKREFVSVDELVNLVNLERYASSRDNVLEWIENGGPPVNGHAINLRWLKSSLKHIAPEIPSDLAGLPEYVVDKDPGMQEYLGQFNIADETCPEIMICTHAMLAVHTKHKMMQARYSDEYKALRAKEIDLFEKISLLKGDDFKDERKQLSAEITAIKDATLIHAAVTTEMKGVLPPFKHLVLDEAHLFESAMSNSAADYLSLTSFAHTVADAANAGFLTKGSVAEVNRHLNVIRDAGANGETFPLTHRWANSGEVMRAMEGICTAIAIHKQSSAKRNEDHEALIKRLAAGRYVLNSFLKNRMAMSAFIRYSPVRAFPQLYSGVSSVERYMGFLWATLDNAACVSATLYLRRTEDFSSWYQRSMLSIPDNRVKEFIPCIPSWCFLPVKSAYIPADVSMATSNRLWLRPPTASDKLNPIDQKIVEADWIDSVADTLKWVWETADGGVLVLISSYEIIIRLGHILKRFPELGKCLIAPVDLDKAAIGQDVKISTLAVQRREFLNMRKAGKKAIWLATGGAWTGLDVGGHQPWEELFGETIPAHQDNVLTDLVVPRLPYGLNKSITHATRIDKNPGVPWEMLDAMFTLRQAIGRLVRRSGLPENRRIFLLDGRLNDKKFLGATTQALTILRSYKLQRIAPSDIRVENEHL